MNTPGTSPLPNDVNDKADVPTQTPEPILEDPFEVLVQTVTHVFSREYMSHDPTFVAHLDTRNNEFSAPLSVVAELPIIKALTSDMEYLKRATKKSNNVIFNEETCTCKPTFKLVQRTTLILRDIPVTTQEQEVRALFASDPEVGAGILDAHYDVGDNYFVTFANEEVTIRAFNLVRERDLHFNGKKVSARIKSESLLKKLYYVDPAVLQLQQQQQEVLFHDPYAASYGRGRGRYNNNRRGRGGALGKDYNQGRKQGGNNGANANNRHNNKRGGPSAGGKDNNAKTQNVSLNGTSHWPPLQEKGHSTSGYTTPFKKYSRQQVVSVFTALSKEVPATPSPSTATQTSDATNTTATTTDTTATSLPTTTTNETTTEEATQTPKPTCKLATTPPQWLVPTSQLPIFSELPFTQLEVMRPVKETKVEFNESKKRKHHEKKPNEEPLKPDHQQPHHHHPHHPQKQQHQNQQQKSHQHHQHHPQQHHQQPHHQQPQQQQQQQQQATPAGGSQSKAYAEAAKSAPVNSTG